MASRSLAKSIWKHNGRGRPSPDLGIVFSRMSEFKVNLTKPTEAFSVGNTCPWLWRVANAIMAVFLAMAAYVQINDPDPAVWMTVYGIPCILCASVSVYPQVISHFIWKAVIVSHLTACIVGALYLSTVVSKQMEYGTMNPLTHEEGRELCGLALVIVWLALCKLLTIKRFSNLGAFNYCFTWAAIASVALLPFLLWGLQLKTLDSASLPGHCKNLILD